VDPATWICAILADLFASSQEREKERETDSSGRPGERLRQKVDELRDEIRRLIKAAHY
jgi:hypothetical protein